MRHTPIRVSSREGYARVRAGGTRPRDLRSSYVTLRVYEGIPLTQLGREVGTSVRMIEQHYAGADDESPGNAPDPSVGLDRRPLPYLGRVRDLRAFTTLTNGH